MYISQVVQDFFHQHFNSMLVKRNLFWSSPKGWRWWSQKLDGTCVNGRGSNSSTSNGACSPDNIHQLDKDPGKTPHINSEKKTDILHWAVMLGSGLHRHHHHHHHHHHLLLLHHHTQFMLPLSIQLIPTTTSNNEARSLQSNASRCLGNDHKNAFYRFLTAQLTVNHLEWKWLVVSSTWMFPKIEVVKPQNGCFQKSWKTLLKWMIWEKTLLTWTMSHPGWLIGILNSWPMK